MSRVGLKKITVPNGVTVKVNPDSVQVKGPKGENQKPLRPEIKVAVEGSDLTVSRSSEDRFIRSLHGLTRNEIQNMIVGVTQGFERILEINGVGFRAVVQGRTLLLNLGYSHQIHFELPKGIDASVEKQTIVTIKGIDKYLVGQVAANIRALREPEPYKGKGIKYREEKIIRKEGKTGK
ncbi:MAG: 50S ribosomal protein L6 [Nitrospirae bacterium]|nr:50S ribosomal protein L6 [Candidatus Manganitrophaceae bacterium]